MMAPVNSLGQRKEQRQWKQQIDAMDSVEDPVFILGHWRSGTTLLHYLLCLDDQLTAPNNYQMASPFNFLSQEAVSLPARLLKRFGLIPETRPMDQVRVSLESPQEDEQGLFMASTLSPIGAWLFPRHHAYYERFFTFEQASDEEREQWKTTMRWLVRKLSLRYPGKRLVLKSPPHTARIPLLLELFPHASFIHIHRHPYEVFQSFSHFYNSLVRLVNLQRMTPEYVQNTVLRWYRIVYDSFFAHQPKIPNGNWFETCYDHLKTQPEIEMEKMYAHLGFNGFDALQPRIRAYLNSLSDYQNNQYPPLENVERELICQRWEPAFKHWNYQP